MISLQYKRQCTRLMQSRLQVMSVVRTLTKEGMTIVATIHSPTPFCFNLFDRLMILIGGYAIYHGPNGEHKMSLVAMLHFCGVLNHFHLSWLGKHARPQAAELACPESGHATTQSDLREAVFTKKSQALSWLAGRQSWTLAPNCNHKKHIIEALLKMLPSESHLSNCSLHTLFHLLQDIRR